MRFFIANLKHAYYYLKKNTAYSVLTIIGLTVGLTVFLLVALFVYNEETVDQNIPNSNRIYRLIDAEKMDCGLGYELKDIISQNYPEAEANCVLERYQWPVILRANNHHGLKFKTGISTTNSFFKVFAIPVLRKMDKEPFSGKASIILTQATAKKLFGDKDPLGQTIDFNHFFKVKVTAIIKAFPKNTSLSADYLINAEDKKMRMSTVCNHGDCYNPMNHFLLLKKHTDKNQFIKHFNQSIKHFQSRVSRFDLQPLTDIYLSKQIEYNGNRKGNPSFIRLLSIIGLIILILSVINYLNFSLSLQFSKIKEISIKKVNGANHLQLFFYYLTESLIVIVISTILSLLLVFALKNYFASLIGGDVDIQILKKPLFIVIYLAVLFIILGINSIIPVYSLLKINVIQGLHSTIKRKNKSTVRTIFTTTQFVASIALLISVFFIQKQLNFVESKALGFNQQNLLKVEIPYKFKHFAALKTEINNLSFVKSSSYSFGSPGEINLTMGSGEKDIDMDIKTIMIDSSFLHTFQVHLLKGRRFLKGDFHKACMFNETAIKKLGWQNLENRKYKMGKEGGYDVIGIVNNFSVSSLHKKQQAVCLIYDNTNKPNTLSVRIVPGHIHQQISQIKKVWATFTEDPFDFQFYNDFFNAQYKKERQLSGSIGILAIIAIILTLIGILGQVIQTCANRTKEIGIRKVNGATVLEMVNLLNLDFVKWVLIAFVIATPIAYYSISKWLENFPYKTSLSWWVFAMAGIIVLFVTLVTVSLQTFRAARRNPIEALRYE